MKTISLLVFSLVVLTLSAQGVDYLQNGIAPQFTNARDYERVSTPPTRKHDSSKSASILLKRLLNDTINQRDSNGLKQGYWIYYGSDRPESGIPANGKVEEGTYIDDKKEGIWIKYHNDGVTPKLKAEYKNNRPVGNYTTIRGNIIEIGNFEKNQYHDSVIRGSSLGREYEAFFNENGKEEGRVNYYYSSGQLEFTYNSVNGTPTGKATRYYENGDIKERIEYSEDGSVAKSEQFGQVNLDPSEIISAEKAPSLVNPMYTKGIKWNPDGYNKVYNEDDEVWQDGIFKEGKLWEGKLYVYDRDGILLRVKVFKNGVYHSDGQL
ncbi:MAG: hypothetical protein QE487_15755 [Fluviicola sp.]|nr:hypothetical protein [Fluviicola sp.]